MHPDVLWFSTFVHSHMMKFCMLYRGEFQTRLPFWMKWNQRGSESCLVTLKLLSSSVSKPGRGHRRNDADCPSCCKSASTSSRSMSGASPGMVYFKAADAAPQHNALARRLVSSEAVR